MKTTTITILLTLITATVQAWELPHISVQGTGEATALPDALHWNITLQTSHATLQTLATNHHNQVHRLLQTLRQFQPQENQIQTSRMNLQQNWIYRNHNRLQDGYKATTTITLQTDQLDTYTACWKAITQHLNITIDNVRFITRNPLPHLNKARKKALQNARKTAHLYAQQLGVQLLEPLELTDLHTTNPRPTARNSMQLADSATPQPIAPGQQTFRATIRATYRISSPIKETP
jgi:uncharacterized protein YggE